MESLLKFLIELINKLLKLLGLEPITPDTLTPDDNKNPEQPNEENPCNPTDVPSNPTLAPSQAITEPSPITTVPSTVISGVTSQNGNWWKPALVTPWQWQISGNAFNPATDMISGVHVYDIDLFNNSAAVIADIKARDPQAKVICYMETGAWEDYRSDASQYPTALLGNTIDGFPNEKFVDIRNINNPDVNSNQAKLRTILKNRLQMCKDKGFDGVEPDLDDTYSYNTGFSISMADNIAFNKFVADEAHARGLSIGLKNGSEVAFAQQMAPIVDWALNEQCFQYNECQAYSQYFVSAGKAVFQVEYQDENASKTNFCPKAKTANFNSMLKTSSSNLDAYRDPC